MLVCDPRGSRNVKCHSYWYAARESQQIEYMALSAAYQMRVVSIFLGCTDSGQRYHDNPLLAAALNREALSHCGHASLARMCATNFTRKVYLSYISSTTIVFVPLHACRLLRC